MKDLEFIRSVVKEWPSDASTVRLDIDGEFCFEVTNCQHDFYPDDIEAAKSAFIPKGGFYMDTGAGYTRSQWEK